MYVKWQYRIDLINYLFTELQIIYLNYAKEKNVIIFVLLLDFVSDEGRGEAVESLVNGF